MGSSTYHLQVGVGRRVVLPLEVCEAVGVGPGEAVILRLTDGVVSLTSVGRSIERFQELVASRKGDETPPTELNAEVSE